MRWRHTVLCIILRKGWLQRRKGWIIPRKGFEISQEEWIPANGEVVIFAPCQVTQWCSWPDCGFCSTLFSSISAGYVDIGQRITTIAQNGIAEYWSYCEIMLKFECLALTPSASLLATFGTFIRYNDGRAKTGTAVDGGNFRVSRRRHQRQNAKSQKVV